MSTYEFFEQIYFCRSVRDESNDGILGHLYLRKNLMVENLKFCREDPWTGGPVASCNHFPLAGNYESQFVSTSSTKKYFGSTKLYVRSKISNCLRDSFFLKEFTVILVYRSFSRFAFV